MVDCDEMPSVSRAITSKVMKNAHSTNTQPAATFIAAGGVEKRRSRAAASEGVMAATPKRTRSRSADPEIGAYLELSARACPLSRGGASAPVNCTPVIGATTSL